MEKAVDPMFVSSVRSLGVVAIVLGGGRGTRLYPLTKERAKPAVPVGGRYRLVDIPLSNCIHSGINRIFVVTQFNSRSLHRHINETFKFDIFSRGFVEILAAEQTEQSGDWFQGTADAIRQNLWHFRNAKAEHFLILSGDHLYRMDYADFLREHVVSDADISVATLPVDRISAPAFGVMKVEDNGDISEFMEKPDPSQLDQLETPQSVLNQYSLDEGDERRYLASMGVYLFKREVLENILVNRTEWTDFGKDVIPGSLANRHLHSYVFPGFWEDIGTVRSYYNVSMRLVEPDPPFEFLDPMRPIYTHPRYLPGARIQDGAISDSIVCEGSRIVGAEIANSIIGIRSIVDESVSITRSILMGADQASTIPATSTIPVGIGSGSTIERAIIDKNARIGRNVVIRGREGLPPRVEENHAVVDGIVVILKNAVIPDGTVIE